MQLQHKEDYSSGPLTQIDRQLITILACNIETNTERSTYIQTYIK